MDTNELKLELSRFITKLRADYTSSGKYTDANFDKDMQELDNLAFMQMIVNLTNIKAPLKEINDEDGLKEYVSSFSKEELTKALEDASKDVVEGYLKSLYGS